MEPLNAKPYLLKQANLSSIRNVIKTKKTATRAEIAKETQISSTTVRTLLSEMMQANEIESIGYDVSSGGRKAERYRFQPNRYYGAAFCITGNQIHSLLVNVCGEVMETTALPVIDDNFEATICTFLDPLLLQKEIKAIGIGVPGIVEGTCFWRKQPQDNSLVKINLGETLAKRYHIPVVVENDLNATVIGFHKLNTRLGGIHLSEPANTVYLHFEEGCVSTGILVNGRIVRGFHNFAGELGLIPLHTAQTLNDLMACAKEDTTYVSLVTQIISWLCGILNPENIVLSGSAFRVDCLPKIKEMTSSLLSKPMSPAILHSADVWKDYHEGMAFLTAEKMFDDVQFIKE